MKTLAFAAAFLAIALPAASAEDTHPALTAFIKAIQANDKEGIGRFIVRKDLQALDTTGQRKEMLGRLASISSKEGTNLTFMGGADKGVILIEPPELPFPVRKTGERWVFDVPTLMGNAEQDDKDAAALARLYRLKSALETYRSLAGRYPTQNQGLTALVEPPQDPQPKRWKQMLKELPKDPWGNDFLYEANDQKFSLRSLGPDGKKSVDDITLPEWWRAFRKHSLIAL